MQENQTDREWAVVSTRWCWSDRFEATRVFFSGRGADGGTARALEALLPGGISAAWARQIHSCRVLRAEPGENPEGDALVTKEPGLAVAVVTADCVPVLLTSRFRVAAVHAGWRGLVSRILPAAIQRFEEPIDRAWIGPSIGACCYEVGEDVAEQVCRASCETIRREKPGRRPHLDLAAAAAFQLRAAGVEEIVPVGGCTRCEEQKLWSYRRDGSSAGRNLAAIWRLGVDGPSAER